MPAITRHTPVTGLSHIHALRDWPDGLSNRGSTFQSFEGRISAMDTLGVVIFVVIVVLIVVYTLDALGVGERQ